MKIVVNDVKGKQSYQREVPKDKEGALVGRKIGEKVEGGIVGLAGYALQITGGSDVAGFPMRKDVPGQKKVKVVTGRGVGLRRARKGTKYAKNVSGNTIAAGTAQVNAKIVEYGPQALDALGFVPKPKEAKAAEKAAEKKK